MGRRNTYIEEGLENELIIPGYPKGSDLTLLNTAYIGRSKDEYGELLQDFMVITFKDNTSGAKKNYIIYEPLYTFYKLKPEWEGSIDYNLFFIEKEKLVPITCKYSELLKAIAVVTDNVRFFSNNIADGNSSENKKLHVMTNNIFMSDMNVENYYRFLFNISYKNDPFKLNKSFLDIEVDGTYALGDFPEPGEAPINAIAYCDENNKKVYQFILNDPKNPLIEQYRQSFDNKRYEELKEFVITAVGGYKKAVKFGCQDLSYKVVFFDDELELITKMFKVINATVPDFLMIWNMAFDLNYIIARIQNLGGDPLEIICDNRIPQKYLRFYVDTRNLNDYAERGDFVTLSTYTVWLDQMIQFASRRKGRGQYQSFKLDAIGEEIAGVRKLDYSHITSNINLLPYLDMKTFSFYNIMDVIVQKCIEISTQDCEYTFTKCLVNNTIYAKCHRQSVYLSNRFAKEFYEYGFIIGNNKNLWNEKPKTKFPGACVGNPLHNSEDIMMKINDRPVFLFNNVVDFD